MTTYPSGNHSRSGPAPEDGADVETSNPEPWKEVRQVAEPASRPYEKEEPSNPNVAPRPKEKPRKTTRPRTGVAPRPE
jgi:hypothetical protein